MISNLPVVGSYSADGKHEPGMTCQPRMHVHVMYAFAGYPIEEKMRRNHVETVKPRFARLLGKMFSDRISAVLIAVLG